MSAADEIRRRLAETKDDLDNAVQPEVSAALEALETAQQMHAAYLEQLDKIRAMSLHLAQRFSAIGGDLVEVWGDETEGPVWDATNIAGLAYELGQETAEFVASLAQVQEESKASLTQARGLFEGLGAYCRQAADCVGEALP